MTGEYSDHRDWIVDAYTSKSTAEERILKLDAAARVLEVKYPSCLDWKYPERGYEQEINPEDPYYDRDYNGTRYLIGECFLHNEVKP